MRTIRLAAILMLIIMVTADCMADEGKARQIPYNVSILRLIASPEKYDGKHVTVRGYLRLEFEGDALYLHREDYERSLLANAVSVGLPDERTPQALNKYDRQYVVVSGVFSRCDETRFVCTFSGHIGDIGERIDFWPRRVDESRDERRK